MLDILQLGRDIGFVASALRYSRKLILVMEL